MVTPPKFKPVHAQDDMAPCQPKGKKCAAADSSPDKSPTSMRAVKSTRRSVSQSTASSTTSNTGASRTTGGIISWVMLPILQIWGYNVALEGNTDVTCSGDNELFILLEPNSTSATAAAPSSGGSATPQTLEAVYAEEWGDQAHILVQYANALGVTYQQTPHANATEDTLPNLDKHWKIVERMQKPSSMVITHNYSLRQNVIQISAST
ncbi:hypothetical protein ONZ45_g6183 [Pleurotus djamor]|nr:hypothetical protein ONZ45_g6183 [Pleurotus djamor]